MFAYNTRYAVTHPWVIVRECWREVKWAWQRAFRGWDDRATWAVDNWLSDIMPPIIRKLRDDGVGYPAAFDLPFDLPEEQAAARWNQILTDIADGFEAHNQEADLNVEDMHKADALIAKRDKGLALFARWYGHLWS